MAYLYTLMMINILIFFGCLLLSEIASAKIIVALQNRPPQITIEPQGQFKGPIIEIAKKLIQGIDEEFHFQPVLWSRALRLAQLNENLLLTRHSMTETRKEFLLPIVYGFEKRKVYFYKNKKSKIVINNIEDLKKYKIGYRRSSFYFPEFQQFDNEKLHALDTDEQLIKMVANNRVDLILFNDHKIFEDKLKRLNNSMVRDLVTPIDFFYSFTNPRFFSVPKYSKLAKNLYTDLNCSMLKLRKSGFIKGIFEKYQLTPPIQIYSDPHSKVQISSCH